MPGRFTWPFCSIMFREVRDAFEESQTQTRTLQWLSPVRYCQFFVIYSENEDSNGTFSGKKHIIPRIEIDTAPGEQIIR